jgi:uncharacterized protein (TIGR03437 family)
MSLRSLLFLCAAAGCAQSQSFPAFRWIQQVDGSASDAVVGIGTDATGNVYIAGNTMSIDFPVKSAAQSHRGSSGLYRIDGPGAAWTALPLASAQSIAPVSGNPNMLYAATGSAGLKSTDGGQTWSTLPIPSTSVLTIAIDPSNSNTLYAGSSGQGAFKSTDGGATWTAIDTGLQAGHNNQIFVSQFWIDPNHPNVVFANSGGNNGAVISANGGVSWTAVPNLSVLPNIWFDKSPGVIYATNGQTAFKSVDDGQTWSVLAQVPGGTSQNGEMLSITSDPNYPGALALAFSGALFTSSDDGATWPIREMVQINYPGITPDWANGALYASSGPSGGIVWINDAARHVGPPALAQVNQIAVANGQVYVAVSASNAVFVTKLDSSGNIVYSTYFGGSANDTATAMSVDPSGNVYVTGTTSSLDFPTTAGSYCPAVPCIQGAQPTATSSFVFRLNPDGSRGYSTYLTDGLSSPGGIAVDATGDAFIAGTSQGDLPTTPGAYQPTFSGTPINCASPILCPLEEVINAFLTELNPTGATLVFSTYIGSQSAAAGAVALAPDGTIFLGYRGQALLSCTREICFPTGSNATVYHMNATGGSLLGTGTAAGQAAAIAVGPDGNVYVTGSVTQPPTFQGTAGAFEPAPVPAPVLQDQNNGNYVFITRFDPNFKVLASTLLGGDYGDQPNSLAIDASGNVLVGGSTGGLGFPTRTPLFSAFWSNTGFVSKLTADLSTLLFSTYLGDAQSFAVDGVAASPDGDLVIAGTTAQANVANSPPTQVWVNKIGAGGATQSAPLPFRIDAVLNAASLVDTALSPGETIVIQGAGFASGAQLSINGAAAPLISVSSQSITAVVAASIASNSAVVQVQSGGALSNAVVVPVAPAAPGLFSADGSGIGQGYILNADGTLNTPANPAKPGSQITVFATGVGLLSFAGSYAVAQYLPAVFLDGFYLDGVAATFGPVQGFAGQVYQLTVTIPTLASVSAAYGLQNFTFPPQSSVVLESNGASSQIGLAVSISQ